MINISQDAASLEKPIKAAAINARILATSIEFLLQRDILEINTEPVPIVYNLTAHTPSILKYASEISPAQAIDKQSYGERAKDSSYRENGDRNGPECGEGVWRDVFWIPFIPRLIIEALYGL